MKRFGTWNQFSTLLYAQAGGKTSLRDIEHGLAAYGERGYHLGLRGAVHRKPWREFGASFGARLSQAMSQD